MNEASWSGHIALSSIAAMVMTSILARVVLARYRRAVLQSMRDSRGTGIEASAVEGGEPGPHEPPPLRLEPAARAADPSLPFVFANRRRLTAIRIFAVAGAVHSAVLTILVLLANPPFEGESLTAKAMLILWPLLAWLLVPTIVQVSAFSWRLALLGPVLVMVLTALTEPGFALTASYLVGIPTAIGWILLTRAVRAVATFIFVGCFSFAFLLFFALQAAVAFGDSLGEGTFPVVLGLIVILTLAAAVLLGYLWLRTRARGARSRRTSDQLLLIDAWWFLYAVWISMVLSQSWGLFGAVGLSAFAVYWLLVRIQMRAVSEDPQNGRRRRLLLLRVFGFRKRSEDLVTTVGHLWRYLGSIELIAGPDVATVNLEPYEALDYLAGRLSRRFVTGAKDLDSRIADRDLAPDRDGRFRVNDFFCHENTWRATMQRLASGADVVMMDLRTFSASNRGCEYELEQLLLLVPLPKTVFLLDETTDEALLGELVREKWRTLGGRSVNAQLVEPRLAFVRMQTGTRRAAHDVMRVLCDAAA